MASSIILYNCHHKTWLSFQRECKGIYSELNMSAHSLGTWIQVVLMSTIEVTTWIYIIRECKTATNQ